jgi:hypothetical protein
LPLFLFDFILFKFFWMLILRNIFEFRSNTFIVFLLSKKN